MNTKIDKSLEYLSSNEVRSLKDQFRDKTDKYLSKFITDEMSKDHVNALRSYIKACHLARNEDINLDHISKLPLNEIRNKTKILADPLFDKTRRKKHRKSANNRFKKLGRSLLGTSNRRLYFELDPNANKSETELRVEKELAGKGYIILSYKDGYATDKAGKQKFRIGKLIKDNGNLLDDFKRDQNSRAFNQDTLEPSEHLLVLSNRASDIAYMSTRRAWTSCMAYDHRLKYKNQIPADIEHGSLIAYLVKKSDPNIYDPLSRALLKPYYNVNGDVKYYFNRTYGLHNNSFVNQLNGIVTKLSSNEFGLYKTHGDIYRDHGPDKIPNIEEGLQTEEFLNSIGVKYKYSFFSGNIIIKGDLDLSNLGLKQLPNLTNVEVRGNFNCADNQLTSLIGAPQKVKDFNCRNNQLTSLVGSPQKVRGFYCECNQLTTLLDGPESSKDYYCNNNNLTSLEGAPQKTQNFNCSNNKIVSLLGGPKSSKDYYCSNNQLTSLVGSPESSRDYHCNNNKLISLEEAPQKVRSFYCNSNNLSSLKGAPQRVYDFYCDQNNLTSLVGGPQKVRSTYSCSSNKLTSITGAPQRVYNFLCNYNNLTSLIGVPENFKCLTSDFGSFYSFSQIPSSNLVIKKTNPRAAKPIRSYRI